MLRSGIRRLLCTRAHSVAGTSLGNPNLELLKELCAERGVEFASHLNPELQGLVRRLANEHIRGLVRQRSSFHKALDLFQDIAQRDFAPELSTCIEIIRGFCNRGEVDPAIQLLRRMSSDELFQQSRPTTPAFNIILSALSKNRERVWEMRELFLEMRGEDRSQPDSTSYSLYLLGLYRAGRVDDAMVVKKEMLESFKPDRFVYSALITGFCKAGMFDQAQKQLQEMMKLRVEPDSACFTPIIDALERKGRFGESIELFQKMMTLGVKPDRVLCTRLMDCFIDRGELAQAVVFLQELLENGLCAPAMSSINLLVRRLCIADKLDEGIRMVKMMNEHGCNASLLIYCDLIAALCEKKRAREAADVYFDGKLLGHLLEESLNPGILQKLWGVKQSEEKVVEMMNRSGGDVCAYNFELARLEHGQQLELLQKMIEQGIVPDYQSYEIVIKGLCRAGKGLESYQVFEQLVASSRVPSSGMCCKIVEALLACDRDDERVKQALRQMIEDGYVPDDKMGRVIACLRS